VLPILPVTWPPPPDDVTISTGELHMWWLSLRLAAEARNSLEQTLSPDEHARARRYRFKRDHDRFVGGRGLLRALLGRYLAVAPHLLRFSYTECGKPCLSEPTQAALRFNFSRSGEVALCAISGQAEVGVDLEEVRAFQRADQVLRTFLNPADCREIEAHPDRDRLSMLFRCWAAKEAYAKALGCGLSESLTAVSVWPLSDHFVTIRDAASTDRTWAVAAVDLGVEYAAAVAVEDATPRLMRCWAWNPFASAFAPKS
jgi:4'-phosphopantetheinyl transferase